MLQRRGDFVVDGVGPVVNTVIRNCLAAVVFVVDTAGRFRAARTDVSLAPEAAEFAA